MKMRANNPATESLFKVWMKRTAWALPLFFLVKGLMWLTVPALYLAFALE
jgi:hypothetical protein